MSNINNVLAKISGLDSELSKLFKLEIEKYPIFFKNFVIFGNSPGAVSLKSGIYVHTKTANLDNIIYMMFIFLHEIGHFQRYDSINYDMVSLTELPIDDYLKQVEVEENFANNFALEKLKELSNKTTGNPNVNIQINKFIRDIYSQITNFNPGLYYATYNIIKTNIKRYKNNGDKLILDILSGKVPMYENEITMNKEDIIRKKIAETIKNLFEAPEVAPAQPKIKPDIKPAPAQPNPRRILKPIIHPGAKPAPKAKYIGEEDLKKKVKLKEIYVNFLKLAEKKFLSEAPMNYQDDKHNGPNLDIKNNIEKRGTNPFSKIDVLHKDAGNNQKSLERLGDEEYKDVINTAKKYNSDNENYGIILQKIKEVMILQKHYKANLEQLAKDVVQYNFGIPDDVMAEIFVELKDDFDDIDFALDDENEIDLIHDFTPEEQEIIKQNVDKRIISNALMMGAGFRAHNLLEKVKPALDAINPAFFKFYSEIMSGHAFSLWKYKPSEEDEIKFQQKVNDEGELKKIIQNLKIGGKSELILGQDENGDGIREVQGAKAEAVIFPVLLHEVVKAVMEYIFANGLPQYTEHVNKEIMRQSEKFHFEHWHKLLGPRLWKYLHDAIDYIVKERDSDYTIVAYLLQEMSMLPPNKFLRLIDLLIHDGATAITWLEKMLDRVENDLANQEGEEIPQSNFANIDNLMGQIQNMLNQPGAEQKPEPIQQKPFNQMSTEELQNFILDSINAGDFDKAAEARDELETRGE